MNKKGTYMKKIFSNVLVGVLSVALAETTFAKDNTDSAAIAAELAKLNSNAVVSETTETENAIVDEAVTPEEKVEVVKEEKIETPQESVIETESEPEVFAPRMVSEPTEKTNPEIAFPRGLQIGAGLSVTSGVNGFIGYNNKKFDSFWWKRVGVRADFATMSPLKSVIRRTVDRFTEEEGGFELDDNLFINDFELKSHHFAGMIDLYPFGDTWFLGGLRVSGGYYFGKTELSANLTGKVDDAPGYEFEIELDGKHYRYVGNNVTGKAKATWDFSGPYLGAGFDLGLFAGFKIYLDAGVVFTSKNAELDLVVDSKDLRVETAPGVWKPITQDALGSEYNAYKTEYEERKTRTLKDAQDEMDKIDFYPIVKLGFMYRF